MSNYAKISGHTFASIHDRAWALVCEAEEAAIAKARKKAKSRRTAQRAARRAK